MQELDQSLREAGGLGIRVLVAHAHHGAVERDERGEVEGVATTTTSASVKLMVCRSAWISAESP